MLKSPVFSRAWQELLVSAPDSVSWGLRSSERCSLMSLRVDLDFDWNDLYIVSMYLGLPHNMAAGFQVWVSWERAKPTIFAFYDHATEVIWHWFFGGFFFLHSSCPDSHKGLPRITGRGNRLFLLMGQWEGSGKECGTRNSTMASYEKYSLPQIISQKLISWGGILAKQV